MTDEQRDYLNELRESGETNMFGASSYLEQEFDLEKHEAREVLAVWMATFAQSRDIAACYITL